MRAVVCGVNKCSLIDKDWKFMDFKKKSGKTTFNFKAANKKVKE